MRTKLSLEAPYHAPPLERNAPDLPRAEPCRQPPELAGRNYQQQAERRRSPEPKIRPRKRTQGKARRELGSQASPSSPDLQLDLVGYLGDRVPLLRPSHLLEGPLLPIDS